MNGQTLLNARFEILWLNNSSKHIIQRKNISRILKRENRSIEYWYTVRFLYSHTAIVRSLFTLVNRSIFNVDYELFMIPRVNVCVCT